MMIENKNDLGTNISVFLIFVIISWCFKASYFSYAIVVFSLFLVIDAVYSYKHERFFLPKQSKRFSLEVTGILTLYLLFILTSLLHGDHLDLVKALDCAALCVPFFMTWWISNKYDIERGFYWGILIGAIIACCIGLYQWYVNPGVRIRSSYAHPNHFGTMINLTLPIIGYYALNIKNYAYKLLSICTVVMQIICLYFTSSRGALLALMGAAVLGLIWAFVSLKRYIDLHIGKYIFISIIIIFVGGGFALHYMERARNMDVIQMMQMEGSAAKTGGERVQMIKASVAMWEDHKLIGVGAGHWGEEYYGSYRPADIREEGHSMPHNMPLFFLSTSGIVGFAGYITFLFLSAYTLSKVSQDRKDFYWSLSIYMVFLSFLLQGFVDTTIINKIPARMFFALMGSFIMLGYSKIEK